MTATRGFKAGTWVFTPARGSRPSDMPGAGGSMSTSINLLCKRGLVLVTQATWDARLAPQPRFSDAKRRSAACELETFPL
jgi:hypothetical protein